MAKRTAKKANAEEIEEIVAAKPPSKSWLARNWKWLVPVFIVLAAVVGYGAYASTRSSTVIVTEAVRRSTLEQSVEATGVLESIDEVDLSFETSGTVKAVYFDVGDTVEEGELIAALDKGELEADVDRAAQAVQIAQSQLDLEEAGASSEEVRVALAAIDVAQAALGAANTALLNAQKNGDSKVGSALASLETAQDNLGDTLNDNAQNIQEAKADLVSTLKSSMVEVRSALSDADEVLGVQNMTANDEFEDVLSHADPSQLIAAERSYEDGVKSRDAAEDAVFALSASSSAEAVEAASALVEAALGDAAQTLLDTRRVLDATVIETIEFSGADLTALKTSIDTARDAIQTEESAFISDTNGLASAVIAANKAESAAKNAVTEAEKAYDSAIVSRETGIAAAEADVAVKEYDLQKAQASLDQIEADPRFVDIAGYVVEIQRARADLAAAQARAMKAEIRAPISGELTKLYFDVGEQVNAGVAMAVVQTVREEFHVVADVAESDIPKVALNDAVAMTFDAFGDDIEFGGTVSRIDPAEKEVEGVTFYEIEIDLDATTPGLKPGMSVDATVMTESISDVLIIPQRAILQRDGEKYVRIPIGKNTFEDRVITTGLRGDGGLVQATSGLEEGESIIISIRE